MPSFTKGAADISILRIFPMTAVFVSLQCTLPILLRFYSSGEVFGASPALQETVHDPERSKGPGNVVALVLLSRTSLGGRVYLFVLPFHRNVWARQM